MSTKVCKFPDCGKRHEARGLCAGHYTQAARGRELRPLAWQYTNPDGTPQTQEDAFWARVAKTATCWFWTGGKTTRGYGQLRFRGKREYAHRYSYRLANDALPDGVLIDHLCHNRSCVRPSHLRAATEGENSQNRRGASRQSKTGIRNVYEKRPGVFEALLKKDGAKYRKSFSSLDEADQWAAQMRERLYDVPRI